MYCPNIILRVKIRVRYYFFCHKYRKQILPKKFNIKCTNKINTAVLFYCHYAADRYGWQCCNLTSYRNIIGFRPTVNSQQIIYLQTILIIIIAAEIIFENTNYFIINIQRTSFIRSSIVCYTVTNESTIYVLIIHFMSVLFYLWPETEIQWIIYCGTE